MRSWHLVGVLVYLTVASMPLFGAPKDSPEEAKSPLKVIHLDATNDWKFGVDEPGVAPEVYDSALLLRQIFRQAMLMAARDELGLTARDAAIGDPTPADGDRSRVVMGARNVGKRGVYMERSGRTESDTEDYRFDGDYLHAIARAEEMSRTWFLATLKKLGFEGEASHRKADAKMPESVERLLSEMTFTSQFQAVRLLHEAIRRHGESDLWVGALVRGYSNLGWLTEHQWLHAPQVFKARALLYAQRMVARGEHPVWAEWHRAYALAAAGLHAKAMDDLKSADTAAPKEPATDFDRRPAWADLIDAHCRFDLAKLDPERVEQPYRQLAMLLRMINVELANGKADGRAQNTEIAMAVVQAMPECYRAHDSLCAVSGVGIGHQSTVAGLMTMGQRLYGRLAVMQWLPPEAAEIVLKQASTEKTSAAPSDDKQASVQEEFVSRGKLIAALMGLSNEGTDEGNRRTQPKADAERLDALSADRSEPSWATLGFLIREESFLQVWQRARFLKSMLYVAPDEFVTAAMPLVADHPYRTFIETFTFDRVKEKKMTERLLALDLQWFDVNALPICDPLRQFDPKQRRKLSWWFNKNNDMLARNIAQALNEFDGRKEHARTLSKLSPFCPLARAYLVQYDWESTADKAEQWEKEAAGTSVVLLEALGRQYQRKQQFPAAERCFKAAVELSPDRMSYGHLAGLLRLERKDEEFVSSLKGFLEHPDYGLGHTWARMEIAVHHMNKGEWETALPYSEEAAEAYSERSLECVGECYEGLRRWDKAEAAFRAESERYRDSAIRWYGFCRRTGTGDVQAAQALMEQWSHEVKEHLDRVPGASVTLGIYLVLKKDLKLGLARVDDELKRAQTPMVMLQAALMADELGDDTRRDELLQQVIQKGKERSATIPNAKGTNIWQRLAGLMVDDLAKGGKGEIDTAMYERIIATLEKPAAQYYHWFFGKYLQLHGKEDKAIYYWKRCLALRPMYVWPRTLAGAELVARGYAPDCYRDKETDKEKEKSNEEEKTTEKEKPDAGPKP